MADDGELGPAPGGGEPGGGDGPTTHTGGGEPGGGDGPTTHTGGGDGPTTHTGGGDGPTTHTGGGDRITIVINNKEYQVDKPSLTGAELKRLAGEPPDRLVVWIKGDSNVEQGGEDESILDDQSINLVGGMKFRIVNAATFG